MKKEAFDVHSPTSSNIYTHRQREKCLDFEKNEYKREGERSSSREEGIQTKEGRIQNGCLNSSMWSVFFDQ